MLRAVIFDFDGIIVDSEPTILRLFQEMSAQLGFQLTEEYYYEHLLAFDDREVVRHLFAKLGRQLTPASLEQWVAWKARRYLEAIRAGLPPFPGVLEFIEKLSSWLPLAVATGSLRREVEVLLKHLQIDNKFSILVTAEDVEHSKPEPEIFLLALERLACLPHLAHPKLSAAECLVIEDSPAGIRAAHAAGMKCLALTHSQPEEKLAEADWVAEGFPQVNWEKIVAALA